MESKTCKALYQYKQLLTYAGLYHSIGVWKQQLTVKKNEVISAGNIQL